MTVSSVGPAVRQAAIDARNQLKDIVAGFLNKPIGSIRLKDGQIYTNGDSHLRVKTSEIVEQAGEFTIIGKGAREPNHSNVDLRTFGAQFADVEVDVTTGEVKVHKIVTVHDFGRVINRLGSQNQAEGAVVQGIGFALTEKRVIDERNGIVLNANLEDYLVPTDLDFNEIECAFIDAPDNLANSLGAKGLGEPALIPTAPAIANALRRATGTRFLSLPITRDKILERMK
jgi:xanthine dehydrogenase YagR molybdenum-binding subunit